jgi:hypothetical protein
VCVILTNFKGGKRSVEMTRNTKLILALAAVLVIVALTFSAVGACWAVSAVNLRPDVMEIVGPMKGGGVFS